MFPVCERGYIYNRIKILKNPSKGVSSARNTGVRCADGEYIMFIDSDDSLSEDALSIFIEKIEKLGKSDIVISSYETIYPSGKAQAHEISDFHGDIASFCGHMEEYLNAAVLQGPCWKLFKRKLLMDHNIFFPETMDYGEDACFVYEYLKYAGNVIVFADTTYHYHIQDVSLSQGFRREKYEIILILIQIFSFYGNYFDFKYNASNLKPRNSALQINLRERYITDFFKSCFR